MVCMPANPGIIVFRYFIRYGRLVFWHFPASTTKLVSTYDLLTGCLVRSIFVTVSPSTFASSKPEAFFSTLMLLVLIEAVTHLKNSLYDCTVEFLNSNTFGVNSLRIETSASSPKETATILLDRC